MGSQSIMKISKRRKFLYKLNKTLGVGFDILNMLSDEQLDYINFHFQESTFLEACPGSGKTEVIGLKTAYYINLVNSSYKGLAIITFTQSAAKELTQRIQKYNKGIIASYPQFVGTFDSWIHNYIFQPFGHSITGYLGNEGDKSFRIVSIDSTAPFLNSFSVQLWKNGIPYRIMANQYYLNSNGHFESTEDEVQSLLNDATVAEKASLLEIKRTFFKAGFATYSDAEYLSFRLLTKKPVLLQRLAQRFPIILVDECQDLSPTQIKILGLLKNQSVALQFVGDLNQSIYEFRKVDPTIINNFIINNGLIRKKLTNNFRSCQPIVDVTGNLISSASLIEGHEQELEGEACLLWEYDTNTFCQLPQKFNEFILSKGLNPANCAILARGTATLKELRPQSPASKTIVELIANALNCWHAENRQTIDIYNALNQMGKALCLLAYSGKGNSRAQFCPENISSVEWRNHVRNILISLKFIFPFQEAGKELTWSEWVAKLKVFFNTYWINLPIGKSEWEEIKNRFRAPQSSASKIVTSSIFIATQRNDIRSTTIHSVKGETLDAVLLLSHKNKLSKGGHYSHWLIGENTEPEHIRFAYVACSRPKFFLILATPKLSEVDKASLTGLGFTANS